MALVTLCTKLGARMLVALAYMLHVRAAVVVLAVAVAPDRALLLLLCECVCTDCKLYSCMVVLVLYEGEE
jgi:predicted phosphoribosyltransferase